MDDILEMTFSAFSSNNNGVFWLKPRRGRGETGFSSNHTETEMSSFWWHFHHWLHWKLSKWQLPVQPVIKISSKWRHFRFSVMSSLNQKMTWYQRCDQPLPEPMTTQLIVAYVLVGAQMIYEARHTVYVILGPKTWIILLWPLLLIWISTHASIL